MNTIIFVFSTVKFDDFTLLHDTTNTNVSESQLYDAFTPFIFSKLNYVFVRQYG